MKFPKKYSIPSCTIFTLVTTELTLRLVFGMGNPVLLQADPYTGYRFQPNQKVVRFGNTIEYNQYSQRSKPITAQKPPGTLRILMTGDSILNGGTATDQEKTIPELLEAKLLESERPSEVLNASAGSWGIGNQLGYLREFGTFESDAVIVQIGTHDLTQPTSTSEPVGHHPSYPDHRPILAIQEAFIRYLLPQLSLVFRLSSPPNQVSPSATEVERQFQENMQNLKEIATLVRAKNAQIFVLFTPNTDDLLPTPRIPRYKSEFIQVLNSLQIPIIDTQAAWASLSPTVIKTYFRDNPHLSVPGNQAAANLLFERLCLTRQLLACSK